MKFSDPKIPHEVLFLALFLDFIHVLFPSQVQQYRCFFLIWMRIVFSSLPDHYINAGRNLEFICTYFLFFLLNCKSLRYLIREMCMRLDAARKETILVT